jgi:hypothetical protein
MPIEYLVVPIIIGLLPAAIAKSKGESFFLWWFFGAALWIVAFPASLFLKQNRDNEKKCPECAEWVLREALVCKHCRHAFPVSVPNPWDVKPQAQFRISKPCG